ncbi:YopX family protein [Brevibacillus sp. BC25]|uniref:YopX family protein n=1 Tax=Brevibacillus sp. BC25 TaxID=1144308 RepID=UPI000271304C|nr:YopX family protein [Brevibacillus sp. BC25]EJL29971.1 phage uncharacterized protein TIGR01671 [Brevibacillus sp. BC25]
MQSRRVVKFRAWDPDREKMMHPMVLNWWQDEGTLAFRSEFIDKEEPHECTSKYLDEVNLLQYTGLRDKNGKEIYEGDIVHVPDHDWNGYVMFTGDCQYALKGKTVLGNDGYLLFTQIYINKCEVIGNIYENPELL